MSALPEFTVRTDQRGRLRVVAVEGEVDVLTAPRLGAVVDDDEGFDDLVIDLSKVPESFSERSAIAVTHCKSRQPGRRPSCRRSAWA